MKTIGLMGGMSWESTQRYYELINTGVKQQLGGLHSAKIVMVSLDFHEIETLQHAGKWDDTAILLSSAAKSIELAGADFLLICTNTMHKVAPQISNNISIPILHIADATAEQLVKDGVNKVGLIGTRFTMEEKFYKQRLVELYGIEVIVPNTRDRLIVHNIIYDELCLGIINSTSRKAYENIIDSLANNGAESVILGCTEIALLIQQVHTSTPLYDTTRIHAMAAIDAAIKT